MFKQIEDKEELIVELNDEAESIQNEINNAIAVLSNNLRKLATIIHCNNGNRIFLTEPFENTLIVTHFDYENNKWNIKNTVNIDYNYKDLDYYYSVDTNHNGNVMVIGLANEDANTGVVKIYDLSGSDLILKNNIYGDNCYKFIRCY